MSHKPHIVITVIVLVLWAGIVAAAVLDRPAEFPAFEMTREVTRDDGTEVYQFVYGEDETWLETLVSSTADPDRVGHYRQGHGYHIWGLGYHMPGLWFGDAGSLKGRARRAGAATMITKQVGSEEVVTIVRGFDRTEARFDAATGILVYVEFRTAGRVIERHVVTSLVTADGETVR